MQILKPTNNRLTLIMYFMRKFNYNFIVLLLSLLSLVSCEDEIDTSFTQKNGQEYFPQTVGKWLIYEADSIVWNSFTETVETIRFEVKEEVVKEFVDTEGRPAVEIERSYRNNATQTWSNADFWYSVRDDKVAERVENNLRFTKLSFPLVKGKQWQGNGFINGVPEFEICRNWDYTYTQLDTTFTAGASFSNVVEVTQVDSETGLSKCYSKEYYAPNVGLISKSIILLQLSDPNETIPWQEKVERGYIYNQHLIEHN